jgi:hypothetical protein
MNDDSMSDKYSDKIKSCRAIEKAWLEANRIKLTEVPDDVAEAVTVRNLFKKKPTLAKLYLESVAGNGYEREIDELMKEMKFRQQISYETGIPPS